MSLLNAYVATLSGAGTGGILLSDLDLFDVNGSVSSVSYRLTNAGDIISINTMFGTQDIGDWASPKSLAPGSYEVRVDLAPGSDSLASGTVGSWEALTTTRTWTLEQSTPGYAQATLQVQIRLGATVLTSANVNLSVDVFGL